MTDDAFEVDDLAEKRRKRRQTDREQSLVPLPGETDREHRSRITMLLDRLATDSARWT